jgi:hypothetical protein
MRLAYLSSLITEMNGISLNTMYPRHGHGDPEEKRWLVLGKYISERRSKKGEKGAVIQTPCIAAIDLWGVVHGGESSKGKPTPKYGLHGLQKLKKYLPDILGYVDDKQIAEKPEINAEVISKIFSNYGEEGVEELKKKLEEDPEYWRHREVEPGELTQEILDYLGSIRKLKTIEAQPRPLKGTAMTTGRVQMGAKIIKDPIINGIFKYYYRTPAIPKMTGGIRLDKFTTLDSDSVQEQSEELYKTALIQINDEINKLKKKPERMKPIVPTPAEAPKPKWDVTHVPPWDKIPPLQPVADPEGSPFAQPEPETLTAKKEVTAPGEVKTPTDRPVLKAAPGQQRKAGIPPTAAPKAVEPTGKSPVTKQDKANIDNQAKQTWLKGKQGLERPTLKSRLPKSLEIEPETGEPEIDISDVVPKKPAAPAAPPKPLEPPKPLPQLKKRNLSTEED